MYVYISGISTTHFAFILNMLINAMNLVIAGAMQTPMDVASSDGGTDNEATKMRKAEKEEKKLEDEYKAEQKQQETEKKSILDARVNTTVSTFRQLNCDTAARFKYRNSTWS